MSSKYLKYANLIIPPLRKNCFKKGIPKFRNIKFSLTGLNHLVHSGFWVMLDTHIRANIACESQEKNESYGYTALETANPVIRKFINSAVYVEAPIRSKMPPLKKSPLYLNYASDDETYMRSLRVKRCVCSTDKENCPCHPQMAINRQLKAESSCAITQSKSSISLNSNETASTVATVKARDEFKLSLASLTTNASFCNEEDRRNDEAFKSWLSRKEKERQLKQLEKEREELQKKIKKEQQLQQERENFKNWLAHKKIEEEKKKQNEKMLKQREEQFKEEERQIKQMENELRFQAWLKRKEKEDLEKKIRDKMESLRSEEEKQRRLEESAKSYEVWLQNSKYKPKPLPLNRGMESLRSSLSVTYINPTPWVPNIEDRYKPYSQ